MREAASATAAQKRLGRGRQLHVKYVGQAQALFRSCRSGAVQQSRRELHAAGGAGPKELAARGQREGRPQGRGDSFDRGVMPQAGHSGERLSVGGAARHEPEKTFRNRSTHPGALDGVPRARLLTGENRNGCCSLIRYSGRRSNRNGSSGLSTTAKSALWSRMTTECLTAQSNCWDIKLPASAAVPFQTGFS